VNQLQFDASIAERDVVRYTPAGIPIVAARLQHQSEQMEAGIKRLVELDIAAVAAGENFRAIQSGGSRQPVPVFRFSGEKIVTAKASCFTSLILNQ